MIFGRHRRFEEAIRLNPSYATAHQWYSEFLTYMGRHDEAVAEGRKALALDPLSLIINNDLGQVYYFARRYNEAIGVDTDSDVNLRRLTNIGTLRAYLVNYLRHHPDIHLAGLGGAHRHDRAFFQGPEELGLQVQGQFADLVEQQRAAVRVLELALAVGDRAGERSLDVPEQLGLDRALGHPGGIGVSQ